MTHPTPAQPVGPKPSPSPSCRHLVGKGERVFRGSLEGAEVALKTEEESQKGMLEECECEEKT